MFKQTIALATPPTFYKIVVLSLFIAIYANSCTNPTTNKPETAKNQTKPADTLTLLPSNMDKFAGTAMVASLNQPLQKDKNSVYCPTLLFAWDEILKTLGPVKLPPTAHPEFALFNQSSYHQNTLDKADYTTNVRIETIDGDTSAIEATAFLEKNVEFTFPLDSLNTKLNFKGTPVKAFGNKYKINKGVSLLYYKDDDNFIISLTCKDTTQQLMLYKLSQYPTTFLDLYTQINSLTTAAKPVKLIPEDYLAIPYISVDLINNYKNLINQYFIRQTNNELWNITKAQQTLKYNLNHKGSKLKSTALIEAVKGMIDNAPKPKQLVFDKPFVIFQQRKNTPYPYLAIHITNPELLVK